MIEAELKARVKDVEAVRTWLQARAEEEEATYHDTYYDWPDHRLDAEGQEIRLRTVTSEAGSKHLLTYKQPPVDVDSGSKPEYETIVTERRAVEKMINALRLVELVSYTKKCYNFRIERDGRPVMATIAMIPEIQDAYLELEIISNQADLGKSLETIRILFESIGLLAEIEAGSYTSAVRRLRRDASAS